MSHQYAKLMFTDSVKDIQRQQRSRSNYERMEQGEDVNYLLSNVEADFIAQRDSFYMASVSETGWPYVQHRGGPAGFMRVLDARTLGFADFSGNRQYISTGNVSVNDRVSLIFMDYPNRRRLKLLGRVEQVGPDQPERLASLKPQRYRAKVERGFIIHVEAFDWNCPQHITPRFSEQEVEQILARRLAGQAPSSTSGAEPVVLGDGPLALEISGIRQLSENIRAYELRSKDHQPLPPFSPGAHIKVPVILPDGTRDLRHYSLCSDPTRTDRYEIAVLNQANGKGGSAAIHQTYQLGVTLHCETPSNYFDLSLQPGQPVMLIAGGIGITPVKALAHALPTRGHPTELHYAGKQRKAMAFADELQGVPGPITRLYAGDQDRRLNLPELMKQADRQTVFFVCGPERLLREVQVLATRLAIPASQIRMERFGFEPSEDDQPVLLKLAESGREIQVPAQTSLLDALLENGIDAPFSCQTGQCKQCAVGYSDGTPDHRDRVLTQEERKTLICPCVSRASSPSLTLTL
ncbi:2Fe-2S iron-sulfur cluster-binding protein [Bowmanella dokdonensis]|uniref:Pyridoxamine 5'-phosphate oxidase family protein n=1 Tax=Bowmanella dokdonensis TaxID=751969 RepID=A0A939DNZ5_9ALTE|nr:pyridoxamine 5'-phosphate oxidase family protein [Bowmanella dokdonensis]MBN7826147.1 pyridoxamine 5'-phosphate oxidase family protein [Bowmanella dokdonensis]